MDSAEYLKKVHGTNMRVTRQAAKEAARVIGKSTKRKRYPDKEAATTPTNGAKDQGEDGETDGEEMPPNKIRKVSGEAEKTNNSEEEMEVNEDEEDEDQGSDQDQDMNEGEDEEDSGHHVQDERIKPSSGEPVAVEESVLRPSAYTYTDIPNHLRSRRSIHLESPGKEVHSHGPTDSSQGINPHIWEKRPETVPPRTRITHYSEEIVFTKPKPPCQNRCPPPEAKVSFVRRPPAYNVPLHRPPAKDGKQGYSDLAKSTMNTTSHSSFAGWFLKLFLVALLSAGATSLYFLMGKRAPEGPSVADVAVAGEDFKGRFREMESSFPSQRAELWKRSTIHLERHLQTAEPTEPVSMILTSGRGAERTLSCLASRMAAAFSSALGASVLHIDGAAAATSESDQVKLDIDRRLIGAFEGDGRAAVVHRLEELPPASALIFYRYCDHENAAFKKALLIFTVLLEEDEIQSHLGLSAVEEMVQERIQAKFLSPGRPASFDSMDLDKLSGLWSRVSHLVLPVMPEEGFERGGCES